METIQERVMRERAKSGLLTILDNGFTHYAKDMESKKDFEKRAVRSGRKIIK